MEDLDIESEKKLQTYKNKERSFLVEVSVTRNTDGLESPFIKEVKKRVELDTKNMQNSVVQRQPEQILVFYYI